MDAHYVTENSLDEVGALSRVQQVAVERGKIALGEEGRKKGGERKGEGRREEEKGE